MQSKLDDFTTKKSKEAKYWLEAYQKICGENPNISGADMMSNLVKKQKSRVVGAANKKEEEEWSKDQRGSQNMAEVVEQAMQLKLHKQDKHVHEHEEREEEESKVEVIVGLGSVPQKWGKTLLSYCFLCICSFH